MLSLRKVGISVLVVAMMIGLIGFTALPGAKKPKPIVLRMAYPSADRGFAPKMIKWWGSNVEKRSGGKIKVEYYWDGLLGTSKEMPYSIERGICDVWGFFPMYFEKELPLATYQPLVGYLMDRIGNISGAYPPMAYKVTFFYFCSPVSLISWACAFIKREAEQPIIWNLSVRIVNR